MYHRPEVRIGHRTSGGNVRRSPYCWLLRLMRHFEPTPWKEPFSGLLYRSTLNLHPTTCVCVRVCVLGRFFAHFWLREFFHFRVFQAFLDPQCSGSGIDDGYCTVRRHTAVYNIPRFPYPEHQEFLSFWPCEKDQFSSVFSHVCAFASGAIPSALTVCFIF